MTPKAKAQKQKWTSGTYQTKKILHSKENYQQNEKATYWNERKYLQIIPDKGLISKCIKDSYNSIAKKKSN